MRSSSAVLALCTPLLLSVLGAFATEEALFASVPVGTGAGPESGPKGGVGNPRDVGGEVRRIYLAAASIASLVESSQSNSGTEMGERR